MLFALLFAIHFNSVRHLKLFFDYKMNLTNLSNHIQAVHAKTIYRPHLIQIWTDFAQIWILKRGWEYYMR